MFDDFSGQWMDDPGYSAADYTSPAGWSTNPSTGDLGGNIDPNTGFLMDPSGGGLAGLLKKYGPMGLQFIKNNPGLLRGIGNAGAAGLGALGASNTADAYRDISNKYLALGAPSRDRYEASFAPGFSMTQDPGYQDALDQTTKATLHGLSVNGNPAGSPNAWTQTLSDVNSKFAYPALQTYRNTNANAGGISTLGTAAPGADTNAVKAGQGVYDSLGAGAANIFNPPQRLSDILTQLKQAGY